MLTRQHTPSILRNVAALTLAACLCACSSDDEIAQVPSNSANVVGSGALLVITERESTDAASLHYLHVLSEWPSNGELDYDSAVELGQPVVAFVQGKALYVYHAQAGKIEKITVDEDLKVHRGEGTDDEISLVGKGISGFDAEPIKVSADLAFVVDEKSAQIARWSPSKMELEGADPIPGELLEREGGMKVQFQLGVAANKRVFTAASYRNWETNSVTQAAALGAFEQDAPGDIKILEDDRCAPSVTIGPFVDQDHVYLVGDGVGGYDLLANPKKVEKPQCVVRLKTDANAFDKDYFINLNELLDTPAILNAFPMADHKLLVSFWSPDEDVSKRMTTKDAGWFWDRPAVYAHAIVDLVKKSATKVEDLPLGSLRSPKVLIVDQENYVQLFRGDKGSDLYRVTVAGKAEKVLENPGSTNVQFLGRL